MSAGGVIPEHPYVERLEHIGRITVAGVPVDFAAHDGEVLITAQGEIRLDQGDLDLFDRYLARAAHIAGEQAREANR